MDVESECQHVRYPYCVVWAPIPVISWFLPFVGHSGIATSQGIIRDFAGSYYVAEDNMAFGGPTKIWQLNVDCVPEGKHGWDFGVRESSLDYGGRMHNICTDNCHSHVASALNYMKYNNRTNWNTCRIAVNILLHGKCISKKAWVQTWLPFWAIVIIILFITIFIKTFPR